jgi:GNAT superfamily N-acetyltransferase
MQNSDITIRKLDTKKDFKEIYETSRVYVDVYRASNASFMPKAYLDTLDVAKEYEDCLKWVHRGVDARIWVAEKNQRIIGYIAFDKYLESPDSYKGNLCEEYDGNLAGFFVDQEYQRSGIGSELFNTMVEEIYNDGYKGLVVYFYAANPAAAFYKKRKAEWKCDEWQYLYSKKAGMKQFFLVSIYTWNLEDLIKSK